SDMEEIKKLKRNLSKEFDMKDLGKVLEKFNKKDTEARCQPLGEQFKLNKKQTPKMEASRRRMDKGALGSCQVAATLLERYFEGYHLFQQKIEAGKELVWLKNFLEELDRAQTECVLYYNNQSAIYLAKNTVFHGLTKHINIRYHYIRELVSKGTLSLMKILGAKNLAYMLTKVVTT
nr:retrovirus-related Pol polyprotein from transposon TNT 1-94 [Tanacetum cinerariifolium]